jgi:hypothetical protein
VGNPEKVSRRPKDDVDRVLALHRELNPVRGCPILIAMDPATGQLFFCAAKGLIRKRLEQASASEEGRLYEEWRQHHRS